MQLLSMKNRMKCQRKLLRALRPKNKNVAMLANLFIFAGGKQQRKNVYTDNPYQ